MSFCQPITSTFAVLLRLVEHLWHVWLLHIVHVIYFEFLVSVTHAPVLSSSPTTLAIFAHSLIPWHCIPAFFIGITALSQCCALSMRLPGHSRVSCDWPISVLEPICLFMRTARRNSDRRRILDFVKLRAKRCPGRGKCGYVRRVVSRGDRVQSHQEEEYRIGWIVKQHFQTFLKTRKLPMPPP